MFGKRPCRLRKGFERYSVHDFQWGQLTAQQILGKVNVFKKATMKEEKDVAPMDFADYLHLLK